MRVGVSRPTNSVSSNGDTLSSTVAPSVHTIRSWVSASPARALMFASSQSARRGTSVAPKSVPLKSSGSPDHCANA